MTQQQPSKQPALAPDTKAKPPASPSAKRSWYLRKRFAIPVAGVLVLLLLVLLAPTLLSTSAARSFILGKVNQNLNGRVEVDGWKLSWSGGIAVTGVQVFDTNNSQIAQLDSLTTELSLVKAIGGELPLGKTRISGLAANLVIEPDGSVNFAKLAKPSDKPEEPASELPKISGDIQLENGRVTVERRLPAGGTQVVYLEKINGSVVITDINSPIDTSLSVSARTPQGSAGTVSATGSAAVIRNRKVDLSAANLDQTITLAGTDAKAIASMLPPGIATRLEGLFDGVVKAKLADGKTVTAELKIDGKQVAFGGAGMAPGEAYVSPTLSLTLAPTTISLPAGLEKWQSGTLKLGEGGLSFATAHAKFSATGEAPIAALLALADNKLPGTTGAFRQSFELTDLPGLSRMLPGTLGVRPGVVVSAGTIKQSIDLSLAADRATPKVSVVVSGIAGTLAEAPNATAPAITRNIAVAPITVELAGTSFGGGWKAPDLRDVKLSLVSGFGTGDIVAPTLAAANGKFEFDLARVRQELGQFTSLLDGSNLTGSLVVEARSKADPAKPAEPSAVELTATLRDLNIAGAAVTKPINQKLVQFFAAATVARGTTGDIDRLDNIVITLATGAEAARTIDFRLTAPSLRITRKSDSANAVDVPSFELANLGVDLRRAYGEFKQFLPANLRDVDITRGSLAMRGTGSYVNGVASVELSPAIELSADKVVGVGRLGKRLEWFKDFSLKGTLAATYSPNPAGGASAKLTRLDLADNQQLLSLKLGSPELLVNLPADGLPSAAGSIRFGVDLAHGKDLYKVYQSTASSIVVYYADGGLRKPRWHTGRIDGELLLARTAQSQQAVALTADLSKLTFTHYGKPVLTDEAATIALRAVVADDLTVANLDELKIKSTVATIEGSAQAKLKSGPGKNDPMLSPLAMARKGSFTITTPDIARAQELFDTFLRPEEPTPSAPLTLGSQPIQLAMAGPAIPAAAAPATTQPASPPLKLASGSAVIKVDLLGDGSTLTVSPDVQLQKVQFFVGDVRNSLGDVSVKTTASVIASPAAAAQASVMDQIQEVRLADLSATAIGTTIATSEPLVVKNLAGLPALLASITPTTQPSTKPVLGTPATVSGVVTVTGRLEPLLRLKAAMAGQPIASPYVGNFSLLQRVATEGGKVRLSGGGVVTDFAARDAAGKTTFAEKSIRLVNTLSVESPGGKTAATLEQLGLIAETSKAFAIEAKGNVRDLLGARQLEGISATLTYDAEPLWNLVRPMLADPAAAPGTPDPYADYVFKGKGTRQWTVGGSFPATDAAGNAVPFNVAIQSLQANGSLWLESFTGDGLIVGKAADPASAGIELPLTLQGGILHVADLTKPLAQQRPPKIACNGGTVDIGGATVDLREPTMTLSFPDESQDVLANVQLNGVLADRVGSYINNPLLLKPQSTKGLLNLRVDRLKSLPLGAAAKASSPSNRGSFRITYSFGGIQLGNEMALKLVEQLRFGGSGININSLQGSITDGVVTYNNGYIGHDMTLVLAEQNRKLRLYGSVRLSDGELMPLTLLLPPDMLPGDAARFLPKGLPVAMTGGFASPQFNVQASLADTVKQNWFSGKPEDVGQLLDLFGGKSREPKKPTPNNGAATRPAANPANNDPVDGLLGNLLDDAARREREKKEREKKEKEKKKK